MAAELLARFSMGSNPPFDLVSLTRLVLEPHQGSGLTFPSWANEPLTGRVLARCSCLAGRQQRRLPHVGDVIAHGTDSTIYWLDPLGLPATCLASDVLKWVDATNDSPSASLVLPVRPLGELVGHRDVLLWRVDASREFDSKEVSAKSFVWYPALTRRSQLLRRAVRKIDPVGIFPLVSFPRSPAERPEDSLLEHRAMLHGRRVRTERLIYAPHHQPDMVLGLLLRSMRSLPRGGSAPREPIVTPEPPSLVYMAELLAAVAAGAALALPMGESPFSATGIAGFAALIRRP